MTIRSLIVFVIVGLLGGCARRDFDGLCKLSSEILTEPRIRPDMRFTRFLIDAANVSFGSKARRLLELLPSAAPEMRYALVAAAAEEEGLEGWRCPAMESVLNPPVGTSN